MPNDLEKVQLLRLHVVVGVFVAILSFFRGLIYFRERKQGLLPEPSGELPKWQRITQEVVHQGLRWLMVWLSISGMLTLLFWDSIDVVLQADVSLFHREGRGAIAVSHGIPSKIYILLFILHIAGLLFARWVKKERVLRKMGLK